jgi:hypothetical protein
VRNTHINHSLLTTQRRAAQHLINTNKWQAEKHLSFWLFFLPLFLSLAACMQHIGLIWLWSARSKQMIPLVAIGRRAIWRLFYVLVEKKQFLSSLFHEYSRSGANVGF